MKMTERASCPGSPGAELSLGPGYSLAFDCSVGGKRASCRRPRPPLAAPALVGCCLPGGLRQGEGEMGNHPRMGVGFVLQDRCSGPWLHTAGTHFTALSSVLKNG